MAKRFDKINIDMKNKLTEAQEQNICEQFVEFLKAGYTKDDAVKEIAKVEKLSVSQIDRILRKEYKI